MSAKKDRLHSYQALLRMARVREAIAGADLAEAAKSERERRGQHQAALDERDLIVQAGQQCVASGAALDLARYEMLSRLDAALTDRLDKTSSHLAEAERQREEKAHANWQAKRYRERAGEQADTARTVLHRELLAKGQEEAVELWVGSQGDKA